MATLTRSTSDVPGASGRHAYGSHIHEHLYVWRPAIAYDRAPLLIFVHGGMWSDLGDYFINPANSYPCGNISSMWFDELLWPVVSIECPPSAPQDNVKAAHASLRLFPGPFNAVSKAVAYLKAHAEDEALWGTGNSVSKSKFVLFGWETGATMAAVAALMPGSRKPATSPLIQGGSFIETSSDSSVRAVINLSGAIDWTQFVFDPAVSTGKFAYDQHQLFMRGEHLTWTGLAQRLKKSISPWWWLESSMERHQASYWYNYYHTDPTGTEGAALIGSDFSPGTPLNSFGNDKAFVDPKHWYQVEAWHNRLVYHHINARSIGWGVTANTQVDYGELLGLSQVPISQLAADVKSWLIDTVGLA